MANPGLLPAVFTRCSTYYVAGWPPLGIGPGRSSPNRGLTAVYDGFLTVLSYRRRAEARLISGHVRKNWAAPINIALGVFRPGTNPLCCICSA